MSALSRRAFMIGSALAAGCATPPRAADAAAPAAAFLPPNVLPISFTALLVNTGSRLVLRDTVRNPYLFARHPEWQPIACWSRPSTSRSRPAVT